jgi:putative ABC transport system substrate-binding protein
VRGADEIEAAFVAATGEGTNALIVVRNPLFSSTSTLTTDLAATHRLPAMFPDREIVRVGGLMAYGPSSTESFRRAAYFVDRILKGAKPADLPVEQPMRFDFVINLKTAQALGLTIPQHVLLQATEVIQ